MDRISSDNTLPLVSIGIVNWNCGAFLQACLRSVGNQDYPNIEVIMVDNASTDGSVEKVERDFPGVKILRNPANVGFGNAHNRAIESSQGAYYMPLNPDAELSPSFVTEMVNALELRPEFGYASGLVYMTADDSLLTDLVYTSGHLLVRSCHAYNRYHLNMIPRERFVEGEIGGACGVCPLYRRAMLDDIAVEGEYFDRNYFMYVEDLDIDWRAHLRGWRCWFTPQAIAWHVMEGTGGADFSPIRAQGALNRWLMILKNADAKLLFKALPYIIKFDLTVILPKMLQRPSSFLHLWRGIFGKVASTLRKRRIIQSHRKWSSDEILKWMEANRAELMRCDAECSGNFRIEKRDGRITRV